MKPLAIVLGFSLLSAGTSFATEIDSCTTFTDEPPDIRENLLCVLEAQHAEEMGVPPSPPGEQTVMQLDELYELGWKLNSMQRFRGANKAYFYRVYIERDN
jgi:hypothetical protein